MTVVQAQPFALERIGMVMEPEPGNPHEAWGVLNPGSARMRDGTLLLYPRVVAEGNYSRIGIAKVCFENDEPVRVERRGYALEPTEGYERNERTAGCEDPRITFVPAIDRYVMAYVAYGPVGPRVALAISEDGLSWERMGIAKFAFDARWKTDFDMYANKDAYLFPEPVRGPNGAPALAMVHRPDYHVAWSVSAGFEIRPAGIHEPRPAMWISYTPLDAVQRDLANLQFWFGHELLATPQYPWEELKIGGGTPAVKTRHGWLQIIHGVTGKIDPRVDLQRTVRYCAGALLLGGDDLRTIVYRSQEPILAPDRPDEQTGLVDNVVFPTALDDRGDGRVDVYYGMADARIGVAKLQVPAVLP